MIEREKDTTVVTEQRESNPLSVLGILLLGVIVAFLLFNYLGDNQDSQTPSPNATNNSSQNQAVPTEQTTAVPTTSTTATSAPQAQ